MTYGEERVLGRNDDSKEVDGGCRTLWVVCIVEEASFLFVCHLKLQNKIQKIWL